MDREFRNKRTLKVENKLEKPERPVHGEDKGDSASILRIVTGVMRKIRLDLLAIVTNLDPSLVIFLVMIIENGDQPGLKQED